jgi:hypothetical protein
MTTPSLSSMQPSDGVVALRSLPRRLRDAARSASTTDLDTEIDDPQIDEMAARVGPEGVSATDLVLASIARTEAIERLLRTALVSDSAMTSADLLDDDLAVSHSGERVAFSPAVDDLSSALERLAELVDDADPNRWTTAVQVDDGSHTTPLTVLQHGVASLVSAERRLGPTLRAVRGRPS